MEIDEAAINRAIELGHADAAAEPAAAAPVLTAADAITRPVPDRVLWRDAPPPDDGPVCSVGEPCILAGPGGSGKSYVALHVAITAASNAAPAACCGLQVRPGPVLLVSYDETPARLGARVAALQARSDAPAGVDLGAIAIVADPAPLWAPMAGGGSGADVTPAFDALAVLARQLRPSLIVIDPVSAAVGGVNLNEGGAARACMRSLVTLSTDTGAGVLLVAGARDTARDTARAPGGGAVAGSAQWFDAARGVLYLRRDAAGERTLRLQCLKYHGRAGWDKTLREVMSGDRFQGFTAAAAPAAPAPAPPRRRQGPRP